MKFFEERMPEFNFPNHMSKEILLLENRRDVPKEIHNKSLESALHWSLKT